MISAPQLSVRHDDPCDMLAAWTSSPQDCSPYPGCAPRDTIDIIGAAPSPSALSRPGAVFPPDNCSAAVPAYNDPAALSSPAGDIRAEPEDTDPFAVSPPVDNSPAEPEDTDPAAASPPTDDSASVPPDTCGGIDILQWLSIDLDSGSSRHSVTLQTGAGTKSAAPPVKSAAAAPKTGAAKSSPPAGELENRACDEELQQQDLMRAQEIYARIKLERELHTAKIQAMIANTQTEIQRIWQEAALRRQKIHDDLMAKWEKLMFS